MKTIIPNEKRHAFGKDIYLLGQDSEGTKYWLEAPSWYCGRYWGFGYVETYTNNKTPERSKDIYSLQHIDGLFMKEINGTFIYNLYDSPLFTKVTFTEKRGWELSELFKQFYLLKEMAEFAGKDKPGCHVAESPIIHHGVKDWVKKINEEMIPEITKYITDVLTPAE